MNPIDGDIDKHTSVWTSAPVEVKVRVRHRTLYFIRHGEAKHNILEKAAIKKAKEDAVAEGFAEDAEETKQRMELARQEILNNESLLDAELSPDGMKEAEGARNDIERIIKDKALPPPTEVLVSPLQRALQTANIVFPGHKNIKVREEVRERLTGKACDRKTSAFKMARRDTFRNFNMNRQLRSSIKQSNALCCRRRRGGGVDVSRSSDGSSVPHRGGDSVANFCTHVCHLPLHGFRVGAPTYATGGHI